MPGPKWRILGLLDNGTFAELVNVSVQSLSEATALTGDHVPPRMRRGKPIKVKRFPTTWSRFARFS
jgi:hypothetical protein